MRLIIFAVVSSITLSACGGGSGGSTSVSGLETPAAVQAVSAN